MQLELKQEIYDEIRSVCLDTARERETLPMEKMMDRLMDIEGVPMHFPYHHFILPAALLTQTAIGQERTEEELGEWLTLAEQRAKGVPGGSCGNCGNCGSAVGAGIFVSILSEASPHTRENWQWANEATGKALLRIADYPGPRCCKRTGYLALLEAVPYINEKFGLSLAIDPGLICKYSRKNPDCLEEGCPFCEENPRNREEGFPIRVPEALMPRPERFRDCDCMHHPVDLTEKKGVIHWMRTEGDRVRKGDVLCEGEVDKKIIEICAEVDGVLASQIVYEDEVFTAGTVLGYIRA